VNSSVFSGFTLVHENVLREKTARRGREKTREGEPLSRRFGGRVGPVGRGAVDPESVVGAGVGRG